MHETLNAGLQTNWQSV